MSKPRPFSSPGTGAPYWQQLQGLRGQEEPGQAGGMGGHGAAGAGTAQEGRGLSLKQAWQHQDPTHSRQNPVNLRKSPLNLKFKHTLSPAPFKPHPFKPRPLPPRTAHTHSRLPPPLDSAPFSF